MQGDYRYGYLAGYYHVAYGNLLSLEGLEREGGGGLGGVFLLSQAYYYYYYYYYYRGYFPGGLLNLRFPPVADTVLPEQDLSYANGRIRLYSFLG